MKEFKEQSQGKNNNNK